MNFFTTIGNPEITLPQPGTTDYYLVKFTINGSITFTKSVSDVSYLVVGGGGGGGAGSFKIGISDGFESTAFSYSGGGGASGDIVSGIFNPTINQPINIVVGNGGLGGIFDSTNKVPTGGSNNVGTIVL